MCELKKRSVESSHTPLHLTQRLFQNVGAQNRAAKRITLWEMINVVQGSIRGHNKGMGKKIRENGEPGRKYIQDKRSG